MTLGIYVSVSVYIYLCVYTHAVHVYEELKTKLHVQNGLSDVLCHLFDSLLAALGLRLDGLPASGARQIENMSKPELLNPKRLRFIGFIGLIGFRVSGLGLIGFRVWGFPKTSQSRPNVRDASAQLHTVGSRDYRVRSVYDS